MKARDVFLTMLDQAGGKIIGKTLIQKRGYFLDLFLNLELNYTAHFYGPYSSAMDTAIGECKALGFVSEIVKDYGISRNGFELKRFDYELTDDGYAVLRLIRKNEAELYEKIHHHLTKLSEAGDLDYVQLSIAAKSCYVLKNGDKPMQREDIIETAKKLSWDITPESVEKAIDFLNKMGLVKVQTPA